MTFNSSARRGRARAASVLLLAAFAACAGGEEGRPHLDRLPVWTLQEDLRIGGPRGSDSGFSQIAGVRVGPDGSLYVADSRDRRIMVYDHSGRLVRQIGGPGSEPGEFDFIGGFGFVGDTLWVQDEFAQRMSLFDSQGRVLLTVPAQGVDVSTVPGVEVRVAPSSLLAGGLLLGTSAAIYSTGGEVPDSMRIPQLRFDADGQVVDTLGWWIRRAQASEALPGTVSVGQNEISMLPAGLFQGQRRTVVAGDTIVLEPDSPSSAAPGTMSVTLVRENGDTAFAQRYRYTPAPVLPAVADSTVAAYVAAFQRIGTTAVDVEAQVRAQLRIPPSFYPVTLVRRPGEETVWLQREDPGTGSARWTILDGEGALLGEAHLPALAVIQVFTGDFLWAVVRDAVGAPYVIRYRVERAEAPAGG